MVRAIENWAELRGTVRDVRPRRGVPHMSEIVLDVDAADDVEGFPNLLTEAPGQRLAVAVDSQSLGHLQPGAGVRIRAQRADPRTVVAHPDGVTPL